MDPLGHVVNPPRSKKAGQAGRNAPFLFKSIRKAATVATCVRITPGDDGSVAQDGGKGPLRRGNLLDIPEFSRRSSTKQCESYSPSVRSTHLGVCRVSMYIYIYMVAPPPRSTLRAFEALQVNLEGLRASHT